MKSAHFVKAELSYIIIQCTSSCTIKSGFLLRFEVPGTNVLIAGTKDGVTAAIFACSAKWEGGAPPPGGSGGPPQKMLEFLRHQGVFWAISGQFGFLF